MELFHNNPDRLAYNPFFWLNHWKVTILSTLTVIALFLFLPLLIQGASDALIPYEGVFSTLLRVPLTIYPLVFLGIAALAFISSMKILAVFEVNRDIAEQVHRNSEEYANTENVAKMEKLFHEIEEEETNSDNLEGKNYKGKDAELKKNHNVLSVGLTKDQIINKLIHAVIPERTSTPEPEMVSMARSIANDARVGLMDRDQNYINPYRERGYEQLQSLDDYQKLSLRLGILGTFVGLLFAIAVIIPLFISELSEIKLSSKSTIGIAKQVEKQIHTIKQSAKSLNQAFTIAFGTSILGLGIAIFTALLARYVRDRQNRYMAVAEEAAHDLVLAVHVALGIGQERVTGSDRFERFQTEMRLVYIDAYDKLAVTLGKMKKTQEEIGSYVSDFDNANKKFIHDFKEAFDISQIKEVFNHTNNILQKNSDSFVRSNFRVIKSFSNDVSTITNTTKHLTKQVENLEKKINKREDNTLIIAIIIISVIGFLYTSSALLKVSSNQKTTMENVVKITKQLPMDSADKTNYD